MLYNCPSCDFNSDNINSLRIHASKRHHISSEDLYLHVILSGVKPTCKCGCGSTTKFNGLVLGYSEYVRGHAARVNNNWGHNESAREKSIETRREMWKNGEIKGWCAGLTKNDPRIAAIVQKMNTPERARKISDALSGRPKSEDHKGKISQHMKEYWSKEENRVEQSRRQAECIKDGMLTKATRVHGYYENPTKSNKHVYYRSMFELNAVLFMEADNSIVSYTMEPCTIQYNLDDSVRHYVIDCLIEYLDGRKMFVEFKPSCHMSDPKNVAKFKAAHSFAVKNGASFEIWTEKTHPFLSNNAIKDHTP